MAPAKWLAVGAVTAAAAVARQAGAPGSPGTAIAGYTFVTDVSQHARLDLDIQAIEEAETDYATALTVYTEGANSAKDDGSKRTLQGFSTSYLEAGPDQAEPLANISQAFWGDWDYADRHLLAALTGNDSDTYGQYGSGELAADDASRTQIIKKVIKFSLVPQYVQHELEEALAEHSSAEYAAAVKHWDEAWAFYAGSLEAGNATGYSAYILPEKRAKNFGTVDGNRSAVNVRFLAAMTSGQALVSAAADDPTPLLDTVRCIRGLMAVAPIQGCLRYAYRVSDPAVSPAEELAKESAEAWAFCAAALPGLAAVDATAAETVREQVYLAGTKRIDWPVVRAAFGPANLNSMGLSCADIGTLNTEHPEAAHPVCEDSAGGLTNAGQGTNFC
ncbi:hypothetical protein MMPV_007581 [Pyropia vietnamensis]